MHVIGTAGHVDHGKSTLVKALTGIDPDRLQEEKDRGMTIDLGFAWLKLPGGEDVSIVDVPGHERFIKNMLAGVGGIDLALLVVAADEGVMPQTREHVAILELLRVHRAVVALTKIDAVDADWLELAHADVRDYLDQTSLADAPIVPVSAHTGTGLADLLGMLEHHLANTPARTDLGRPRLPVDRVFTIAGFGTVVTGTVIGGRLRVGQELEIQPSGIRTRVRGLQTHRQKVEDALPGSRVALNVVGVATEDIRRGDVVTVPGWLQPTTAIDVNLTATSDAPHPIHHNVTLSFHTGAAESTARVLLLQGDELRPGESGWAQLRLSEPVALARGDLFVLRTPNATVGGGELVAPNARRHRRKQIDLINTLSLLQSGTPADLVGQALDANGPLDALALGARTGLSPELIRSAVSEAMSAGQIERLGDHFISPVAWARLVDQATANLSAYHRQFPLRTGMPREELKSRLKLPTRIFNQVISRLTEQAIVAEEDSTVRESGHQVRLTADQESLALNLLDTLNLEPFAPPSLPELRARLAIDDELIHALAQRGQIVLVADDVVFSRTAYDEMVGRVMAFLEENQSVTVASARDLLASSRKYVLALLEHLDQLRITRRVGDERRLR
ncbi:MAG TPA: selenocysteine-specific translation elongation factor [Chloroflexota bacterium]|nr:selenocysteine-specific translation elongation factor [Chloroflexota bacterium]